MDATRWDRVQTLFHHAAALPEAARRAYLDDACAGDDALRADVTALLDEDARDAPLLDRGVADLAGRLLDDALGGMPGGMPGGTPALPLAAFGQYHVTGLLGEGGMGVVYLARRDDLDARAAVKVLRDAWLSPSRRARFASEQRTLARLEHPSIARLYDAGTLADGTPWIVMEYVEGVPLTEHCEARGASAAERLRLFRLVCDAVQHAHGHAIVHRDLKPSNILVRGDGAVKLLDFGIAKQLERDNAPADRTRSGVRLMTPAYAAPEQVRGDSVGTHTDVYALGVVLYELLAGTLPFDLARRTPSEAEALIVEGAPERPSVVARRAGRGALASRAAWADLDVLCLTAMHRDPARRYRTVDALARDVDRYLRGEPLEARPDSARYRLGKFLRRRRGPVSATAAGVALVVALVAFYTARLAAARDAAVDEAARTQRIERFMLGLFEGGDPDEGPADSLRVVTLLEQGAQRAAGLGAEPAVQAELYGTIGGLFQKLGRLDRADTLLTRALARRRAVRGAEHPDVAASLIALGLLRVDQARVAEGERLIRDGLAMARRLRPPGHPEIASATVALGRALQARGAFSEAIASLDEAVRMQSAASASGAVTRELAVTLNVLAVAHLYAGHFATADSLYRRALATDRVLYGPAHPQVGTDLMDLGSVHFERGMYREAERLYRQGLAIFEPWYGPQHPQTAGALMLLAQPLIKLDRADEATPLLERALAIQQRAYGGVHPRVAGTLNALGAAAAARGRQAEAERYYARTADIFRAVYGGGHYLVGASLGNIATTWTERGDDARAERLLREALGIYAKALPPDHLYVGIARLKLGRALLRQRRPADAARELEAGYAIVATTSPPSSPWLVKGRADLAAAYDALGQPAKAARYRE